MKIYQTFTIIAFFTFLLPDCSEQFSIGLFYGDDIEAVSIDVQQGIYDVTGDGELIFRMKPGSLLMVWQMDDSVWVRTVNKSFGAFAVVEIKETQSVFVQHPEGKNILNIKVIVPTLKRRSYNDDLLIKSQQKHLQIINKVYTGNYVAAVAESEGGPFYGMEYYKSQTIIARTYAYKNRNKHKEEGFDLCDGTHCQAYKNRCHHDLRIIDAAKATKNMVIADQRGKLINAVFHSNCGGQTSNSEDSWNSHETYLRAVIDPYCRSSLNSTWTKTVPLYKWKEYLSGYGFEQTKINSNYNYIQINRKKYYKVRTDSLLLFHIRDDFGLKSTFFDIRLSGSLVTLNGRGFGHGVGMCQEGAMQMAARGLSYRDIIHHYYTNVKIVEHE